MKQTRGGWLATMLIVAALGCSSAPVDDTRGGAGPGQQPVAGASGASGSGGTGGGGTGGAILDPVMLIDGSVECEVGKFCENIDPDPDNCGSLTLESEVETVEKPGNVLLIFDRSGSMDQDWNGQKRWEAAGKAIIDALTPIADKLTVGAVFFPSPDAPAMADAGTCSGWTCWIPGGGGFLGSGTCGVNPITEVDQIGFMPGAQFLDAFDGDAANNVPPMYTPVDGGRTPLMEGVQAAQQALAAATLEGTVTTIIVTDGAPNCGWDAPTTDQIVTGWAAAGVNTHVVGLPGADGGAQVLTNLAMLGGTTDFITPTDATKLQQELSDIVLQTVSVGFKECTIALNPAATVPEDLHLIVKEGGIEKDMPHVFDTGEEAWTVSADGATVELVGNVCENAKAATYESIRFEFGCVDLPPAPPPPPIIVE
jgi:hypothetical protein